MKKLLIGTTNKSKFAEASGVLREKNLEILGLRDFPNIKIIEETGDTFLENAFLKAKSYFNQTGVPCLADDGGLEVDYLNGAPGVHSHRWLGHETSDLELAKGIIKALEGVPREKRTARLGGCIVFYDGKNILKNENWIEGFIIDKPDFSKIKSGFPYRAILLVPKFDKLYGDLTEEEHEEVNFRRKNLRQLKPKILKILS